MNSAFVRTEKKGRNKWWSKGGFVLYSLNLVEIVLPIKHVLSIPGIQRTSHWTPLLLYDSASLVQLPEFVVLIQCLSEFLPSFPEKTTLETLVFDSKLYR